MNVIESIAFIKKVVCNQDPNQIGSDVNRGDIDKSLQIPFNQFPTGNGQHPEFLMKDGPRESLDK